MEHEKQGPRPYDDKRYLLTDLPDGRPNPNTHAYRHRDLAAKEHLVDDQPEPSEELIIRHPEERFARRRARVTRRLELAGEMEMEELPDGDFEGELHCDQLLVAKRWQPRDRVAPSERVTSMSGSLRTTTSRAQSRRPLKCKRHLLRNAPDRVN